MAAEILPQPKPAQQSGVVQCADCGVDVEYHHWSPPKRCKRCKYRFHNARKERKRDTAALEEQRTCTVCGGTFAGRWTARYCSAGCRQRAADLLPPKAVCPVCGKGHRGAGRTCSYRCGTLLKGQSPAECRRCGVSLTGSGRRFCGPCLAAERADRRERTQAPCRYCGGSRGERGGRYCSDSCRAQAAAKRRGERAAAARTKDSRCRACGRRIHYKRGPLGACDDCRSTLFALSIADVLAAHGGECVHCGGAVTMDWMLPTSACVSGEDWSLEDVRLAHLACELVSLER